MLVLAYIPAPNGNAMQDGQLDSTGICNLTVQRLAIRLNRDGQLD
jgi:hypothetical protein